MNWYLKVLRNYANFDGRARRSEYWYFFLFNVIISIVLEIVVVFSGLTVGDEEIGILGTIYSLAIFIPSLAVGIRRMHDVGKSGWFILIPLYNLYLAVQDGEVGYNQYGPDPKRPEEVDIADHLVE